MQNLCPIRRCDDCEDNQHYAESRGPYWYTAKEYGFSQLETSISTKSKPSTNAVYYTKL